MLTLFRAWFRILGIVAPGLAAAHAAKLFLTPGRHGLKYGEAGSWLDAARREDLELRHGRVAVYRWPALQAEAPRVLLAHGWSDSAGNLLPLIRDLHEAGFAVTALDWPAHGNSDGRVTNMREWLFAIRSLSEGRPPWHAIVAHSLGGFCVATATRTDIPQYGTPVEAKRLVLLSPPDASMEMLDIFGGALRLNDGAKRRMKERFDRIIEADFAAFSTGGALRDYEGEALVFHDRDDARVPFDGFERIRETATQHSFVETRGLGHRRILEDRAVRNRLLEFITATDTQTLSGMPAMKRGAAHVH